VEVSDDASPDGETAAPGCGPSGPAVVSEGWTVQAGTPVRSDGGVQGCMTFARESGSDTRGGGVCLVAGVGARRARGRGLGEGGRDVGDIGNRC